MKTNRIESAAYAVRLSAFLTISKKNLGASSTTTGGGRKSYIVNLRRAGKNRKTDNSDAKGTFGSS